MAKLNFDLIKYYYDHKHWTEKMVRDSVAKGKITEKQYTEITGLEY